MVGTPVQTLGAQLLSAHMLQHMVLGMVVPILLLAASPVTLALRTLPRNASSSGRPRRWLLVALHSRAARVLLNPVVASAVFVTSLFGLYFTPLLDLAMGSHVGHWLMLAHLTVAGLVFFAPIVAADPWPGRLPPGARLLMLLTAVPFHAFFGVAIMMSRQPLSSHFREATLAAGSDPQTDQVLAGGIAWAFGELPLIVVGAVIFIQWFRADSRAARRHDRQAVRDGDAELAAWNLQFAARASNNDQ
jgi:putative copper resistance protein D